MTNDKYHEVAMMIAATWASAHAESYGDNTEDFGTDAASVYETAIEFLESDESPEFASVEAETMAGQMLADLVHKPAK